jgi:hypothetical protein
MKIEMLNFLFHTQGYDLSVLNMKAPYGETVIDPKSPKPRWFERHIYEIKQRYPQAQYKQYPRYTMGSGMAAWAWRNTYMATRSTPVVLPITAGVIGQTVAVKSIVETESVPTKDKLYWLSQH